MEIELITTILATWGAILSTVVAIQQLQENRRRLKVEINISLVGYGNAVEKYLSLQSSNISKRPISLSSYGLLLPDRKKYWRENESPYQFPTQLTDGQATTIWMKWEDVLNKLKEEGYKGKIKVRGFFDDVTGKRYLSKKYALNLEK